MKYAAVSGNVVDTLSNETTIQTIDFDEIDETATALQRKPQQHQPPRPKHSSKRLEWFALIAMLFSALFFSMMNVFVKLSADRGIPATELVAIRAMGQMSVIVLGLVFVKSEDVARVGGDGVTPKRLVFTPFGGTREVRKVVLMRGLFGGIGFCCYFYTVTALPLGDAITLMSLFPIVSILLARLFLNERIALVHIMSAVVCVIGAVLIARPPFLFGSVDDNDANAAAEDAEKDPKGYITAFGGTVLGGCVFVLMRKAGKLGVHTLQLLFSWAVFGLSFALIIGIAPTFEDPWVSLFQKLDSKTYGDLFGIIVFGIMAHFLMNWAGTIAPAGLGSIFRSSDVVYAYIFEVIVFDLKPSLTTYVGVVLVLGAVIAVGIERWRHDRREQVASSAPHRFTELSSVAVDDAEAGDIALTSASS